MMPGFSPLEEAALLDICQRYPDERSALQAQFDTASFGSRENTGAGFFTRFSVARDAPLLRRERLRDGGHAKVKGMLYPMGFILWLSEGYANCLEGYSAGGDDTSRLDLTSIGFEMLPPGGSGQ